ncbi:hypothetical protein DPMN_090850 [Dreissena polymorpha]|uniref:Uncharacterized protein n=1 Tax=Dreissena polymorpha TaxID=45954 RepID=A0A9D4KZE7_DREPO|nr:hypothetical protein DPMN_090850 [Dreissena polymorpha]
MSYIPVDSFNSPYNAKHYTSLMKSTGNGLQLMTRFWKSDVHMYCSIIADKTLHVEMTVFW